MHDADKYIVSHDMLSFMVIFSCCIFSEQLLKSHLESYNVYACVQELQRLLAGSSFLVEV